MKEDTDGGQAAETQHHAQGQDIKEAQYQQAEEVNGAANISSDGYKALLAKQEAHIKELEGQVVEAAKNAEAAEALRGEIAELKAQGESDRIDFKLQLAGVRNIKAARAVLNDHGGDVDALKAAEPWLFADTPTPPQGGRTGLPNAGTSSDDGKTMKRWRKIAGLDDSDE